MNEYRRIAAALQEFEQTLSKAAPKDSGRLKNSIEVDLVEKRLGYLEIDINMLDYGIYQDKGVSGIKRKYNTPFSFKSKMPPAGAFTRYTSNLSEKFAIARSVYIWGIKPKNFIKPAIDRAQKNILNEYSLDISDMLVKKWKDL